jgi:hypothetical protein
MAIVERSVVVWKMPAEQIPTNSGDIAALSMDFSGRPELLEHMGADRQVVSHSLTLLPDGDFLLSLFLERRPE